MRHEGYSGLLRLAALVRRDDGAVAIVFGIVLVPLALSIGAAIDFSRYSQAKSKLDEAADAGALAAAATAKQQLAAGASGWNAAAVAAGQSTFAANLGAAQGIPQATPTVSVQNNASGIVATLGYQARVSTRMLNFIRINSLSVSNTVKAAIGAGSSYYNVSLALDVSPSMAIAATAADITKLQSLTTPSCAFACHDPDPAGTPTNYNIARANNVKLRLDILKTAAQALTTTVSNSATSPSQFSMAVYGLSYKMRTILSPTTSMSTVSSAISNVDFDTMSSIVYTLPSPAPSNLSSGDAPEHYADSDFAASIGTLTTTIPASGSGASAASPRQVAIIVTDGVSDTAVAYNSSISATYVYPPTPAFSSGNDQGKKVAPIDSSLCSGLKSKGVTVAVLYVPYTPLTSDPTGFYQAEVQTNAPQSAVTANLQACASSSSLFYQATDLAGMTTGLATLFKTAANTDSLRLTN